MHEDTRFSALPHLIEVENSQARAVISLFGGQVLSFVPKHDLVERLWLSPTAVFDGKTPIRGGIPICWPWFGKAPESLNAPNHGYVRNQLWSLKDCDYHENNTRLVFEPAEASHQTFGYQAALRLTINVGRTLNIELDTKNLANATCTYNAALHSYLKVNNIANVQLTGLSGNYIDQLDNNGIKTTPLTYRFNQEVDRIHLCPEQLVVINDERIVRVTSIGNDSVVVWNPWKAKSKTLKDMPDNGYQTMVCIETAITQGLNLAPEQNHRLIQIIE